MATKKSIFERVLVGYRRQPVRTKAIFWIICATVLLLVVPNALRQERVNNLHQARLYFSQPQDSVIPGQLFSVEVRVQTTGSATNAVTADVLYDPNALEVVNMTTENSFCTFYLDNTFDNIKGKVMVSCGLPNPGFVGDSVIVHMNMRAKVAGSTTIKLGPDSAVLANDGRGTNIAQDLADLSIDIKSFL